MNVNGRMKVKTLQKEFKQEFGLVIRVYDGKSFADDEATLASIRKGDAKGGEFSPKKNMKVGNFEDQFMKNFGLKVQIAGSDDSYLCSDDDTLSQAQEKDVKRLAKRAKRKNQDSSDEEEEDFVIDDQFDDEEEEEMSEEEVVEEIEYYIDRVFSELIEDNISEWKDSGTFKVYVDFERGGGKYYLDRINGGYEMSLQLLTHHIMLEKGCYDLFLNEKQIDDLLGMVDEFPDSIYSPDPEDDNFERVQNILDQAYSMAIDYLKSSLQKEGFDVSGFEID